MAHHPPPLSIIFCAQYYRSQQLMPPATHHKPQDFSVISHPPHWVYFFLPYLTSFSYPYFQILIILSLQLLIVDPYQLLMMVLCVSLPRELAPLPSTPVTMGLLSTDGIKELVRIQGCGREMRQHANATITVTASEFISLAKTWRKESFKWRRN